LFGHQCVDGPGGANDRKGGLVCSQWVDEFPWRNDSLHALGRNPPRVALISLMTAYSDRNTTWPGLRSPPHDPTRPDERFLCPPRQVRPVNSRHVRQLQEVVGGQAG
jgi:hypothetical protein